MSNTNPEAEARFNLAQLQQRPNWYDHLPAVDAAMAESDRVFRLRTAAGWTGDEGGWVAPCGTPESDWEANGWPLPEDADFPSWFRAAYHHDAADEGVEANPYPNALTE